MLAISRAGSTEHSYIKISAIEWLLEVIKPVLNRI